MRRRRSGSVLGNLRPSSAEASSSRSGFLASVHGTARCRHHRAGIDRNTDSSLGTQSHRDRSTRLDWRHRIRRCRRGSCWGTERPTCKTLRSRTIAAPCRRWRSWRAFDIRSAGNPRSCRTGLARTATRRWVAPPDNGPRTSAPHRPRLPCCHLCRSRPPRRDFPCSRQHRRSCCRTRQRRRPLRRGCRLSSSCRVGSPHRSSKSKHLPSTPAPTATARYRSSGGPIGSCASQVVAQVLGALARARHGRATCATSCQRPACMTTVAKGVPDGWACGSGNGRLLTTFEQHHRARGRVGLDAQCA